MNLSNVMDQIANRIDAISGLRVVAYPDGQVNPPCAVVVMPERITFDETYGRGSDMIQLPVVVLVSGSVPRAARDALGGYCSGSGTTSIKATVESGAYTAFDAVHVTEIDTSGSYTYNGVDYPAAIFTLEIIGQGD